MGSVTEGGIYQEALIDARGYSADTLQAFADTFALNEADPDPNFPGETGRYLARERLRAIRAELARRERLARLSTSLPSPSDQRYQEWRELARLVRERVDIIDVFERAAYHLHDIGPREAHAACLHCGGTDRLVIRRDPPGRCWCRQCCWSGDVVTLAMSLRQETFRDAVRWLADRANLPAPEPPDSTSVFIPKLPRVGAGNHGNKPTPLASFEYRRGKVVAT